MDLRNLLRNEADVAIQLKKPENPDLVAVRLCHLHVYPFASLVTSRSMACRRSRTRARTTGSFCRKRSR